MGTGIEHSWTLTPSAAIALQQQLRKKVRTSGTLRPNQIKTIAGADCAFDQTGRYGFAGVVVYRYPELEVIRRVGRRSKLTFPYVPGLLSFREAPLLLAAIEKLDELPDLLIFDGQGIAHPRRCGIASHMGLLLDRPSIGCAKSRLIGRHRTPGQKPGSSAPLTIDGEHVGNVLRTKRGCKPVYVSVGHRINLTQATEIVLRCVGKYRIPIPTRDADLYVAQLKARTK
ncbi:MAG: deoxyribonuclease V [Planctomycetes bacterium]|nr:deoxyribonuclease V [Planctomycetota bacterium]